VLPRHDTPQVGADLPATAVHGVAFDALLGFEDPSTSGGIAGDHRQVQCEQDGDHGHAYQITALHLFLRPYLYAASRSSIRVFTDAVFTPFANPTHRIAFS